MTFCVWCSLALVLALPFGSGDSVTSGLSVNRPSADSENLDGLSTSPRRVTVTGPMFSGPGYPTPVAFSFKYMSVTNMLKRRVRHMTKALKPRMSWVKYTSMPGTSPPSSPAADLAQERWVGLGGTTPRLPPDDGLRSWGDHPPGPVASPLIPNGSGRWLVVPGTGNDEGVTCRDGSMAQHDLGGECSRAHSGFALGGVSGLRAVAYASQQTSTSPGTLHGYILGALNINIPYVDWLYDVLNIVADVLSIAGLALALRAPGGPKRILIASIFLPMVLCACPGCFGNAASCTYETDGKCPTIDVPASNAAVVAGLATAAAVGLSLTNVISARFLRLFSRAHLQAVMQLVRRPAPGSIFEITPDTKLTAILAAVSNGLVSLEQATITFAGFIDDEADEVKRKALVERYKLMTAAKDIKTFSTTSATATDMGVYSWLWGKITNFVSERGMQTVVVQLEATSSGSTASVLSTSVKRFADPVDFFEALNLFIMFCTALGLCTAVAVTEFLEHTVFDTIRMRGKTWQVAHELFLVMLRRIEDSGGKLNLVNCINDTYLNTVLEEAEVSAKRHGSFRPTPGKGEDTRSGGGAGSDEAGPKYNGRFNAKSTEVCWFFNSGQPHRPDHLYTDGTCKRNHVCDKWVSNKGPGGVCKGTEGTKGHARSACDNPHRCDTKSDK